jgi:hypothetical protein
MARVKGSEQIAGVQRQLEAWRKSRRPRARIPEGLWNAAAELSRSYGIHKVARALHLDYYNLKDRRDGMNPGGVDGKAVPSFIEVVPSATSQPAECVIELENARGDKMRIHLRGEIARETSKLCAEFMKNGR